MADDFVSVDEFLNERKAFVKSGDVLVKAPRVAPPSWDASSRTVRFVMSSQMEDRDKDIIVQAGLKIDRFVDNPVALMMHRSGDFPVGTWKDVEQQLNGRPPRTEGTLALMKEGVEPNADRVAAHIAAGTIKACSIGFIPKTVVRRPRPDTVPADTYYWAGYEIREAELVECSPVTVPSNPAALAKAASDGDVLAREVIEEVLDTWTLTKEGLLMPRKEYEEAHRSASGNKTSIVVPKGAYIRKSTGERVEIEADDEFVAEPPASADVVEMRGMFGAMKSMFDKIFPAAEEKARKDAEAAAAAEAEAKAAREERMARIKGDLESIAARHPTLAGE